MPVTSVPQTVVPAPAPAPLAAPQVAVSGARSVPVRVLADTSFYWGWHVSSSFQHFFYKHVLMVRKFKTSALCLNSAGNPARGAKTCSSRARARSDLVSCPWQVVVPAAPAPAPQLPQLTVVPVLPISTPAPVVPVASSAAAAAGGRRAVLRLAPWST